MITYGSGLRVSETVHLKPHHIESDRMLALMAQKNPEDENPEPTALSGRAGVIHIRAGAREALPRITGEA